MVPMPGIRKAVGLLLAIAAIGAGGARAATPAISAHDSHALILNGDGSLWIVGDSGLASPMRLPDIDAVIAVATNVTANYVLKADGTVWAWGLNLSGQLGIGTLDHAPNPVRVAALPSTARLSCQGSHCLALASDGSVWAWGINEFGQVGDGSTTTRLAPVRLEGLPAIAEVYAAPYASLALATDGTAWVWGGSGRTRPQRYAGVSGAVGMVSQGADFFLKSDGTVWAHVFNGSGAPARMDNLADIVALSAGSGHYLALRRDGTVWSWGGNYEGGAGSGDFARAFYDVPFRVELPWPAIAIEAGNFASYAMTADGSIYAWGNNQGAGLGDNTVTSRASPVRMVGPGGTGFFNYTIAQVPRNGLPGAGFTISSDSGTAPLAVTVDASSSFDPDGTIARWDWSASDGATGSGARTTFTFARAGTYNITLLVTDNAGGASWAISRQINVSSSATPITTRPMIAASLDSIVALRADGRAFSWGFASTLGRSAPGWQDTVPKPVNNLAGIASIAMGGGHGIAVMADGTVSAWGQNQGGTVGDGTTLARHSPVPVPGVSSAVAAAGGRHHTIVLKDNGTLVAWGSNDQGQLGTGNSTDSHRAVDVTRIDAVTAVAAGDNFTVALRNDGTVWAWGGNQLGQLGDGTRNGRTSPAPIVSLAGVNRIWCGPFNCFAAQVDGVVWAWGSDANGLLGRGDGGPTLVPVQVPALRGFSQFAVGAGHVVALDAQGGVWSWGAPGMALGDGSSVSRSIPARVGAARAIAVAVATANGGSFALQADGTVLSWGANARGEVGDGTLVPRPTPVGVVNEALTGLFDLLPDVPNSGAAASPALFTQTSSSDDLANAILTVNALMRFRPADVGTTSNVYVFALAPATIVRGSADASLALPFKARAGGKDTPVQCVLAQLSASGQLVGVSAASMQAYVTGVLAASGQAVSILNGVTTATIGGATFFVGYGSSGSAMLNGGNNRGVVAVPGQVKCEPRTPQTGWWWNPAEGGRGYSIEVRGNNAFFAAFHYDASGRSTWHVATGNTSLDGSLFIGDLLSVAGGQTLAGPYGGPPRVSAAGTLTLAFNDLRQGIMIWPGGTVPIERFNIVPNGLAAAPRANQPESGWWWNPAEGGRGFFIEWQDGFADLAGYMYDDSGNPVWYLALYETPNIRAFSGNWWTYANGQAMNGVYRPATRVNDNVAPVSIQFSSSDSATLTLPGGRQIPLVRHRF